MFDARSNAGSAHTGNQLKYSFCATVKFTCHFTQRTLGHKHIHNKMHNNLTRTHTEPSFFHDSAKSAVDPLSRRSLGNEGSSPREGRSKESSKLWSSRGFCTVWSSKSLRSVLAAYTWQPCIEKKKKFDVMIFNGSKTEARGKKKGSQRDRVQMCCNCFKSQLCWGFPSFSLILVSFS